MTERMRAIRQLSPREEFQAGLALYQRGQALMTDEGDRGLVYTITTEPRFRVELDPAEQPAGRCGCELYRQEHTACRHIVASLLDAHDNGALERARRRQAQAAGQSLLQGLETAYPEEARASLEVSLQLRPQGGLLVGLRMGEGKLYAVRSIAALLAAAQAGDSLPVGKDFVYYPGAMSLPGRDLRLLELLTQAQAASPESAPTRWMEIPEIFTDRLLRLLSTRPFVFRDGKQRCPQQGIAEAPLPMRFTAGLSGQDICLTMQTISPLRPLDAGWRYLCCDGRLVRLPTAQRNMLRALHPFLREGGGQCLFCGGDRQHFLAEVLPALREAGDLHIDGGLLYRLTQCPLEARVYLDMEGRRMTAKLAFHYGETVIDAFAPWRPEEAAQPLLLRDFEGEQRVFSALSEAGFRVRSHSAYLSEQGAMYHFATEGVTALQQVAQVYCAEAFRRVRPGQASLRGWLRQSGMGLDFSLELDGEPVEDLLPILEAIRGKQQYFFLKDGRLLCLDALAGWEPLAETLTLGRPKEGAEGRVLGLPMSQAFFLQALLDKTDVSMDMEPALAARLHEAPAKEAEPPSLQATLRPYQLQGFRWLCMLYRQGLGGVLADDMGLGKTLETLTLLAWAREQDGPAMSLVVAPSSLVYNWQAEAQRFTPGLTVRVLTGEQGQRAKALRSLASEPVDMLVMSYGVLRQDIEQLRALPFRFVILDEAQQIKNALSLSAAAAKRLEAHSRFALTGTPMENHPGELWSIFDFVLPGYLGSQNRFFQRYAEGQRSDELRMRIHPFLLRRLKREVLAELPEKIEMVLYPEMTGEQRRVYRAALLDIHRQDAAESGRNANAMVLLAALTRLRQICCHPLLIWPEYAASSGKLEWLLEWLPGVLASGHRVLLFSAFTGMLHILRQVLEGQGIRCLYLDGRTPQAERPDLVSRFNAGEGEVFLISLKAGGTGLNLTGADVVVHFDPWWNPAAETQASDRAHRIGQTRAVQVIRLITPGTIEAQVEQLGQRKQALFDALVTSGEPASAPLSESDLRELLALGQME